MSKTETSKTPYFDALRPRWQKGVLALLGECNFNATAAYRVMSPGIHDGAAWKNSFNFFRRPDIKAAIKELLDDSLSPERIKAGLAAIAFDTDLADMEEFFDGKKLSDLRKAGVNTRLIKSASITVNENGGSRKIEMHDMHRALDSLAKIREMVKDTTVAPVIVMFNTQPAASVEDKP